MTPSPFDITDVRRIIFSYIYPPKVKKGMIIRVIRSAYHPFLTDRTGPIREIIKRDDKFYRIMLMNEQCRDDLYWFKASTYLYPSQGDIIKVIHYN